MAEFTAFVREVVLPGGHGARPVIDSEAACFRLCAARSRIHRWGIFAAQAIPARRRVIEYTGERIGRREAGRRGIRPNIYLYRTGVRRYIDGAIGGSGAEYINHGCEPNLIARVRKGRVMLVSLRPIATGEELLLDYRLGGGIPLLPCRCGSPLCRGYMNAQPPASAAEPAVPEAG
ncbi:MAG: SET domain-containing protein-lysine N-methyltransferase [Bryobacteraceae bacterium]|nr:SET domain-containing protein-lysine N-methyltransferase [Bryobacteraceae bacterium]